jgi:hypothetical protein
VIIDDVTNENKVNFETPVEFSDVLNLVNPENK